MGIAYGSLLYGSRPTLDITGDYWFSFSKEEAMRTRSLAPLALLMLIVLTLTPYPSPSAIAQQAAQSQSSSRIAHGPAYAKPQHSPATPPATASLPNNADGLPSPASCLIYAVDKHGSKDAQVFTAD